MVCHFGKYKSGNVFGLQKHNQRENKNYSNMDIDKSKTYLNYDLVNKENIDYLKKVKRIIKENRKSERAIRKDATVYCECIVSSDGAFFENLTKEKQKEFFQSSLDYLKDKIGENFIISANVHFDESTPHMHIGFVPMVENSLSAKKLIDRKFLREVQDQLPAYLKNLGFDIQRGIKDSKRKHKETKEFKKELEKGIENRFKDINALEDYRKRLEEKVEKLRNELDKRTNEFDEITEILNNNSLSMNEINNINCESLMFSSDKVKIDKKDFEKLKDSALKAYTQHNLYATVLPQLEKLKKDLWEAKDYAKKMSDRSDDYYRQWNSALRDKSSELHKLKLKYEEIIEKKDNKIYLLERDIEINKNFISEHDLDGEYVIFEFNKLKEEARKRQQIEEERNKYKSNSYEMSL